MTVELIPLDRAFIWWVEDKASALRHEPSHISSIYIRDDMTFGPLPLRWMLPTTNINTRMAKDTSGSRSGLNRKLLLKLKKGDD